MIYGCGPAMFERPVLSRLAVPLGAGHRDLDAVASGLMHPGEEGALHTAGFVLDQDYANFLVEYEAGRVQGTFLAWLHQTGRNGIKIPMTRAERNNQTG